MKHVLGLGVAVAIVACSASFAPTGKAPKCGWTMHECASGLCCGNTEDCGGDTPGCPAGSCCAAGEVVGHKRVKL